MAEIRINATGGLKLYDADDSHYAQIVAGTITSNTDVMTLGHAAVVMGTKLDMNGSNLILDADADTYLDTGTDDTIKVYVSGAHDLTIGANAINVLSGTTLTIDSGATITNSGTANGFGSADPSSADGDTLGTASAEWSDLYLADGGVIYFGNDQEITLTHNADDGLLLKHVGTGDGKEPSLTFQAGDNDIAQDDVLGSIFFQAPDEGAGTDAVLVAAGIEAVSEGDFSSSNNATKLSFKTAASEAAAEKMSLSSAGLLTVTGGVTMTGATPTLTIGDAGAEDTKIVFDGNAQDFHIGLDDTDDDFKIGLGSTLGTTSHIVIDEAGHVTKPLQPACSAQLDDSVTNTTGDGTTITLGGSDGDFAEVFDVNGDLAADGVFTAPVTGKYHVSGSVDLKGLIASHTDVQISSVASNRSSMVRYNPGDLFDGYASSVVFPYSCLLDMDVNDTLTLTYRVRGDTKVVDPGNSGFHTVYLVC